ncbi:MAG: gephyrin-like molybdotransferase Glp [Bacteroides sp.]|jgi:molybdopterin molybdotransferase|nr:gephyrin-like molybdotransferase Glp [Bacteroides sp.]
MLSYKEALDIVLNTAPQTGSECIDFKDALGRILYEDVVSDIDLPPFDKSAMDGYACRKEDLDKDLRIVEVIPAGMDPTQHIRSGQCAKIMTGAKIPAGADTVIINEETIELENGMVRFSAGQTKHNIIFRAEDVRKGEVVLAKGTILEPQHIAVLATVGCVDPRVAEKVNVGILSTGDEIIEPEAKPAGSQIRNSNAYQLVAQVERLGSKARYYGIAGDDKERTFHLVKDALENQDILILTGGVSMGDFDFIPSVMNELGVEILFRTVSIQPGKPTVYGIFKEKRIFGLPGNPVSSFNTFQLFVKPLILKMSGASHLPGMARLPLGKTYERKKSNRLSWVPVKLTEDHQVVPLEYHGSAHITSLVDADAFIGIPVGVTKIAQGEFVDVRFI